jgi:hypothetical protein
VDDLWVNSGFGAVQMLDKREKTSFVEKLVLLLTPLVFNSDLYAAI